MVAPGVISKEGTPHEDASCNRHVNVALQIAGPDQFGSTRDSKLSEKLGVVTGDSTTFLDYINKTRKPLHGITMNPVVLSIVTHFPNKCIPRKTDTYVVNGENQGENCVNNNNYDTKAKETPKCQKEGRRLSKLKRYAGLILAAMSAMMFSITGLIVKVMPHHHPLTLATWMFVGTVIVAIPLNLLKFVYTAHSGQPENKAPEDENEPRTIEEGLHSIACDIESKPSILTVTPAVTNGKLKIDLSQSSVDTKSSELQSLPKDRQLMRDNDEKRRKLKLFMLLLVRACSGCSGMVLYFYSLKYLNVGDSLVIVCSSPIFVFIIGYLFLGENCGVVPVLTILLSIAGVSVITRPTMLTGKESFEAEDMIGAGLAFGSMLCIAITIIMMRFLQGVYHGLINLVFGVWGTIQTTSLALALGVLEYPHNWNDAVLMSATGVLFFFGQTFLAVALQYEEAGPVSLVRTSEVVFAFMWQFIFLNVTPDVFSISGASLILAGVLLTISRKWVSSMEKDSRTRKIFSVLLR